MTRHPSKSNNQKNTWQIQEAKARFSQLVEDANKREYQTITKKGKSVAVILSKEEFDKMTQPKTSLLDFFKSAPHQEITLDIQRSQDLPTEVD